MRWFLPDAEQRVGGHARCSRSCCGGFHLGRDYCFTTHDVWGRAVGAARSVDPQLGQQVRLLPAIMRVFGRGMSRAQRGLAVMDAGHPGSRTTTSTPWAWTPSGRAAAWGSALMQPMLERCDSERMPAYLNAGSSRSRDLYLRHGFTVLEEFSLPEDGPPLWRMWRDPTYRYPPARFRPRKMRPLSRGCAAGSEMLVFQRTVLIKSARDIRRVRRSLGPRSGGPIGRRSLAPGLIGRSCGRRATAPLGSASPTAHLVGEESGSLRASRMRPGRASKD